LSSEANSVLLNVATTMLMQVTTDAIASTVARRRNGPRVMDMTDVAFAVPEATGERGNFADKPVPEHTDRMNMYKTFRKLRK
jgi:hypothetical protein